MEYEPLTVTIDGFCALTGLGRTTAYKLLAEGAIQRVPGGGRTLISYRSIRAYLGLNEEADNSAMAQ